MTVLAREDLRTMDLPAKLWCRVFHHLTVAQLRKVRLTCALWKRLVDGDAALMDRFTLKFPYGAGIDEKFQPGKVPPARSACFSGARIIQVDGWWAAIGRNITGLRLESKCHVEIPALLDLLRNAPHLKRLELDGLHHGEITMAVVVNFNLANLEEVVLTNVTQPSILCLLQKLLPPLKKFVYAYQDPAPFDALLDILKMSQGTLQELRMPFNAATMEELSQLPRLQLKRVGFCWNHGVAQILGFCKLQPALEELDVSKLSLTDSTFRGIASLLPHLKRLSVRFEWESSPLVPSFLASLPQLESLSMEGPASAQRITNLGSFHCPRLTEFALLAFTLPDQDLKEFFGGKCCQLWSLSFDRCRVGRWGDFLGGLRQLPHLRQLKLSRFRVSDWSDSSEMYAGDLKCLELAQLGIPEASLIKFLSSFPNLEELRLFSVKCLNDRVVHKLCQRMFKLKKVTLEDCPISESALQHIGRCCKQLEQLELSKIANLSRQEVNQLKNRVEIVRFQPASDFKLKKWVKTVGILVLFYYIFQWLGFTGVFLGLPVLFLLFPLIN